MAAGLGYKEFTTGDVLTAADANGYLASQVVMVFASAAARTSAITSPQEGMISYLKDTNSTEYYSGSAWVAIGGSTALPAFSAYKLTTSQTVTSAVWTKVTFNTEEFDTASNFASDRFTPTTAGYYQVNATIGANAGSAGDTYFAFYKNGSAYKIISLTGTLQYTQFNGSTLVYCNGSTDYIEVYVNKTGSGTVSVIAGQADTWFNGVGVRA